MTRVTHSGLARRIELLERLLSKWERNLIEKLRYRDFYGGKTGFRRIKRPLPHWSEKQVSEFRDFTKAVSELDAAKIALKMSSYGGGEVMIPIITRSLRNVERMLKKYGYL